MCYRVTVPAPLGGEEEDVLKVSMLHASGGGSSMRLGGLRQGHNCTLPKAVHRGA